MFAPKVYILVCHGCGKFHEMKSEFISVPMSARFDIPESNKSWCIPCLGCPDCMATPRDSNGDGPIARAWKNGMTPEAWARANKEFTEWLPILEERSKNS